MIFAKKKENVELDHPPAMSAPKPLLLVSGNHTSLANGQLVSELAQAAAPLQVKHIKAGEQRDVFEATAILSIEEQSHDLDLHMNSLIEARKLRNDGTPYLVIVVRPEALCPFGDWLERRAESNSLEGIRLIAADSTDKIIAALKTRLEPVCQDNVLRMPVSPEIENTPYKTFYAISPNMRSVIQLIKELAENNVTRLYLLGAPGTGKTSLAYYYYLIRKRGNFVAINLSAENTGDKTAMKSLLCGHVTGALPGSPQREGALTFAREGVCFLDESHGVTGVVMQVLMEVLDNGQFLPLGATMKRALDCAVIFASNRSWETLRSLIHLDEHARLGATVASIPNLAAREEDLIAVAAASLAKFKSKCTTWKPPVGFSNDAWKLMTGCQWRGNTRTLIRVVEAATVSYAREKLSSDLVEERHVTSAMELWEPAHQHDADLYASFK